jgi:hypothetical protein
MLLRGNSAVELELGTGHESALIRRKVENPVGYIVRLAEASERHLARQLCQDGRLVTLTDCESRIGVLIKVGWTELQRMSQLLRAQCSATDLVRSQTAAFDAL